MTQIPFYSRLLAETALDRGRFLSIPLIVSVVRDGAGRDLYLRYLAEAYHHVRHTCPLLCAAAAACEAQDRRYREALFEYIDEERGHDEWILDDIAALGGDAAAVRGAQGSPAVRVMVGYAYYSVEHVSPYALLGMVHVLEGLSVLLAERAAEAIHNAIGAGSAGGFSYLRSHGALDREHVVFFENLVNGLDNPRQEAVVTDTAYIMYRLYGDVFRGLGADDGDLSHAA